MGLGARSLSGLNNVPSSSSTVYLLIKTPNSPPSYFEGQAECGRANWINSALFKQEDSLSVSPIFLAT